MKTPPLDDLRLFCVIVDQGSFKAAAQALQMPPSTLSRRITQLEQGLGLRLLHRNAHQLALTATGRTYYKRCQPLFSELAEISADLQFEKTAPQGIVRVTAPVNLTAQWLGHHFNQFLLTYPDIRLELTLNNRLLDLQDQAIDVAFRVEGLNQPEWVARRLARVEFLLCGAAARADAWCALKQPVELSTLPLVWWRPLEQWLLWHQPGDVTFELMPGANTRLLVDDVMVATEAVAAGVGLSFLPDYLARPLLDSGRLVRLLPEWTLPPRTLFMLYRERRNLPHRVRLFVDYMAAQIARH